MLTFRFCSFFVLFFSLWISELFGQQYQYSRGWTPGKRSGGVAIFPKEEKYMTLSADPVYTSAFRHQPAPAMVYQTYSPMEIEDLQRSAYIAGLLRERPFGNRGDRY